MVMTKKIKVFGSPIAGKGTFAVEDIEKGELVYWEDSELNKKCPKKLATLDEMYSWSDDKREKFYNFAYQVSDDPETWIGLHENVDYPSEITDELYMNHSCDPNCWWMPDKTMIATRHIAKGEEVCYDYATSESDKIWSMQCLCGAKCCRGTVSGQDYKKEDVMHKYNGHFIDYLQKKIDMFFAEKGKKM